jgi:hypothetical protein
MVAPIPQCRKPRRTFGTGGGGGGFYSEPGPLHELPQRHGFELGQNLRRPLVAPRIRILRVNVARIDYCLCNAAEIVAFDG